LVNSTQEQKYQAVVELCAKDGSAQEIANKYGVSRCSVYNWAQHMLGKGSVLQMPEKKPTTSSTNDIETLKSEIEQLHCEADKLKRQVYRLQLEKDVLEKNAEIIKKDEGVSPENLTNHEKAIVIGALRAKYQLGELLEVFHMSKRSYCYQQAVQATPDKRAVIRSKIRDVFHESSKRYEYRRIYVSLNNEHLTVSEKVIRRIMREEHLIVPNIKRKKYSSYL